MKTAPSEGGICGEAGPSSQPQASAGERRFPAAAQPEVMRVVEKDDHYTAFVHDACRVAFRPFWYQDCCCLPERGCKFLWASTNTCKTCPFHCIRDHDSLSCRKNQFKDGCSWYYPCWLSVWGAVWKGQS